MTGVSLNSLVVSKEFSSYGCRTKVPISLLAVRWGPLNSKTSPQVLAPWPHFMGPSHFHALYTSSI